MNFINNIVKYNNKDFISLIYSIKNYIYNLINNKKILYK